MAQSTAHVYASCTANRRHYLEVMHSGTRQECNKFVKERAKRGAPTHFLTVSSLGLRDATRKICDGARWDEVNCCYVD